MTDTVIGDAAVDVVPQDPFECAKELVVFARQAAELTARLDELAEKIKPRKALVLDAMERGEFSTSQRVLGASVHLFTQVWAGPADKNHAALAEQLKAEGLVEMLPKTVNSSTFSAYVREQIKQAVERGDLDPTLPVEERAAKALPPALAAVTKATEKREVRVTGA